MADHIGSTSSLLQFTKTDASKTYIIATETGILHQMTRANPDKTFIPAPPDDATCACNDCSFMKLISLEKIYNSMKYEAPEIHVDAAIYEKALAPVQRMLDISAKLGL